MSIVDSTLGYELRCASPIPFDIDYTRTLGHAAVRFLLSDPSDSALDYGGLVCLDQGHSRGLPFEELRDRATGRTRVRLVDIHSEHYTSARQYMIRLEERDLADSAMLARLADAGHMSPENFREAFSPVVSLSTHQLAA